jgi:hypothetical protein
VSSRWKKSIPVAGIAAAAALALPGIANAAVTASVAGGVLTVEGEGGDAITITCAGGNVAVAGNTTPFADTLCTTITDIDVTGGDGANVITLTGVTAAAYTALGKVDIAAGAGNDQIFGSEKVDEMHGGPGDDQIIGDDNPQNTRDLFEGEAGNDLLIWRAGEDDDTMNGGDGADVVQVQGAPLPEAFTVKPSATAGRVIFDRLATPGPGPFNLDIGTTETLDLNANAGDDAVEIENGIGTLIKVDANLGDGNDSIEADNDSADLIDGAAGTDTAEADATDTVTNVENGGDTTKPKVAIKSKKLKVKNGKAAVKVSCPAGESACDGKIVIKRNGKAVGSVKTKLVGGQTKTFRVKLKRTTRIALAQDDDKTLAVKVVVTAEDEAGNTAKTTKAAKLKG